MPEQLAEFSNNIYNSFKGLESVFINRIKNIIKQDQDIIETEAMLYYELKSFCFFLFDKNIYQEFYQKFWNFQSNYQSFSDNDRLYLNNLYSQTYEILTNYEHCFPFSNFYYLYSDIQPKEKAKISKFIRDRLEKNYGEESLTELALKERSVRNNDFWKSVETKIQKIQNLEKELQNIIAATITENNCDINVINAKIANQVGSFIEKKIKKQFENIKLEDKADYISYSFLTKYHRTSDKELWAQKVEDELNFQFLNAFYQKYVKNIKDLVFDYKNFSYKKAIEPYANKKYMEARLEIIQPYISSSQNTLTEDDFLEEDDEKNQRFTEKNKIKLKTLKAEKNSLIQKLKIQFQEEIDKNKENVLFFLNKEIISEKNKEKLAQKLEKPLQSSTTEELNKSAHKMPEQLVESSNHIDNMLEIMERVKRTEATFINRIKDIIDQDQDIIKTEESLFLETKWFCNFLFIEYNLLDKIYQKNNDYQSLSMLDKSSFNQIYRQTNEIIKKYQHYFPFFNSYNLYSDIQPKEKAKISKFIRDRLEKNYGEESLNEFNLKERSVRNNDFWKSEETKIQEIKFLEEKLQNDIANIIKNESIASIIDGKIVSEVNQFIEKLKQEFEIFNFEDLKSEDKLNFPVLNDFYQKYVKNSEDLINYNSYYKEIEDANKKYMEARLEIIQQYINSSQNTLTEDDFLEEDDEKNQRFTEKNKIKLKTLKAEKNSLIQKLKIQFQEEIDKNKENVLFFLNKEIISEKNKEKLAQKLEKPLQSSTTEELNKSAHKMPEQLVESSNHIDNMLEIMERVKRTEATFINRIKDIIDQDQDIIKTEESLFLETKWFCNFLFIEYNLLDKIYQKNNDYQSLSMLDKSSFNQIYRQTNEIIKKYQHYFPFFNSYNLYSDIQPKEKAKISKFIRDRLEKNYGEESLNEFNLKERSVRNNDFWKSEETKIQEIKFLEEKLQNDIANIIKNESIASIIDGKIVSEVNQFIEKLKQEFEIFNFEDLKSEDKLNFPVLNDFYQKYVKNSEDLINYNSYYKEIEDANKKYMEARLEIIQQYINSSQNTLTEDDFLEEDDEKIELQILKTERESFIKNKRIEIYKIEDSVLFFLNKEILSEKNKEKLAQKLEKYLQSNTTKTPINNYFQALENDFFIPLKQALNTFEDDVRTINSNYKDQLKELNKRQNDNTNSEFIDNEKKKIFQIMKKQRAQALSNFEYKNSFLLKSLYDITTYNLTWLLTWKKHLFASQLFTYEEKSKYYKIVEHIKEIQAKIEKHKAEVAYIFDEDKVNEIYEHVQNRETKELNDKISKLLTTGIVEKRERLVSEADSSESVVTKDTKELFLTFFAHKDSGEPIEPKVVDKLKFLENGLLINDVLNNIDSGINEWYEGINNLFDANEKIKNLKPYKNLTTVNKTHVVNKNAIFNFKLFPDDNANRRAQFIINTHQRETNINDYLAISGIRKHTFEGTIGQFITFENESIWEKIVHWKNRSINWLKQATHINQKSNWLKKALLLLVSPITIPYGAIKSAYGRLWQRLVPRSNLKNNFKYIEKLKKELNEQCDAIKIKYAELMAIPFEQRSIFSAKKTDNDYLKQANAEFNKITNNFLGILKEQMKPYENYAKKTDSKYYSDGRTMQKIKTILDDFTKNPIKDDNNNDSKYQFTNIEQLNAVLEDRVKHPDYKQQKLSSNIEAMIKCANGLSEDLIDKLTKPVLLMNS